MRTPSTFPQSELAWKAARAAGRAVERVVGVPVDMTEVSTEPSGSIMIRIVVRPAGGAAAPTSGEAELDRELADWDKRHGQG